MDSIELAKALFDDISQYTSVNSTKSSGLPANNTTTITATALSDSEAGMVSVEIDGVVCDVETTVSVKTGDRVIISITGNTPIVTGVVSGGDRTMDAINRLLLKRTSNLLDMSDLSIWDVSVANEERATDFNYMYVDETLNMTAVEQPSVREENVPTEDSLNKPSETIEGEEAEEQVIQTQVVHLNDNSFHLSPTIPIALDGGYILTAKLNTRGITGRFTISATYEEEVEVFPTGEETIKQPIEDAEGEETGEEETIPELFIPHTETRVVSKDLISVEIPEETDGQAIVEAQSIFVARTDYDFNITIGGTFIDGDVEANLKLDLQTKEFIDATGAITLAQEMADEAKGIANDAADSIDGINTELGGVKQSLTEIGEAVSGIDDVVKPVMDAIDEIKGEEESFKDGLEKIVDSTTQGKFVSKNDLLEFESDLQSNISQSASRITFTVSEEDIVDITPEAENSVQEATDAYNGAMAQYQAAQEAYIKALAEKAVADKTIADAQAKLALVTAQVQTILDNDDISPDDKETAQGYLDAATAAYEAAYDASCDVEEVFRGVETDLANAKSVLALAETKLNACRDSHTLSDATFAILADQIKSEVSESYVLKGTSGVDSLGSVVVQTSTDVTMGFTSTSQAGSTASTMKFNEEGMNFNVNGEEVSAFGSEVRIGKSDSTHVEIDSSGMSIYGNSQNINAVTARVSGSSLWANNAEVENYLILGNFRFFERPNGNLSLKWVG